MKALFIIGTLFFLYTLFMVHLIARFSYNRAKRNGFLADIIDNLEAHWNLYKIRHRIEVSNVKARNEVEEVVAEEVQEIERPKQWQRKTSFEWDVHTTKRLGEILKNTELIE